MMRTAAATLFMMIASLTATHQSFAQAPVPYDTRAGLTLMRAINTAENAQRRTTGGYAPLGQLLSHPAMGRVAASVTVNGNDATFMSQQVRLVITPDGQRYQAAIVGTTACSPALFTDEGGYIYNGKVLDCP